MKKQVWITAYDTVSARTALVAGVDAVLVGDSVGNVVYGFARTTGVTVDLLVPHVAAVCGVLKDKIRVVADMPAGSYETPAQALQTAKTFAAAGTTNVKLEGAKPDIVKALVAAGYTVTGHLGLLPQTAEKLTRVAKTEAEQAQLITDAQALATAGAHEMVLECIPAEAAKAAQEAVKVPMIGIGCGPHTAGQVLVWHDVVGLTEGAPGFAPAFVDGFHPLQKGVNAFATAVRNGTFPPAK